MSTKELTQQELTEKINKLPQDLRDTFYSEETNDAVRGIAKKNGLTLDKMGLMYEEINYIILGYSHPKDFIKNLSERLNIDQQKAKDVAQDVNVAIFKPIRDSLKKVHGIEEETLKVEKPSEPPAIKSPPPAPLTASKELGKSPILLPKINNSKPPLSTKPHPDLAAPKVGQEMRVPAEKPLSHPAPLGSFKAGQYSDNNVRINSSPQIKPEMMETKPEEKQPFWKKPVMESSGKISGVRIGGEMEKTKLKEEKKPPLKEMPDIFAKKISESVPAIQPEVKKEEAKPTPPLPSQTPDQKSLQGELEKELNYKSGKDPYREPFDD